MMIRPLRSIAHRLEQALRQLDESFRVYQYLIKRPAAPIAAGHHAYPVVEEALKSRAAHFAAKADSLFELELYLVILYEGWTYRTSPVARLAGFAKSPRAAVHEMFSVRGTTAVMQDQLARALSHLHQKAQAFTTQSADAVAPALPAKAEAFRVLRQLLNYSPHKAESARLKHDTHLDFYATDSAIDCHRRHLEIDGYRVKALTVKEPPVRAFSS